MKYRTQFNHHGPRVDRSKVKTPVIEFTDSALSQLSLLLENDPTLEGMWLRLVVSGKGCDGFDYSVGFTECQRDDFQVSLQLTNGRQAFVLIDPFTAFYLQHSQIDYIQDFTKGEEGFVVKNLQQSQYKGKFWRSEEENTPPLLKRT